MPHPPPPSGRPELTGRLVDRHADGVAVAVDARDGMVVTAGWTETSEVRAVDLMQQLAVAGVPTGIFPKVSPGGTPKGPDGPNGWGGRPGVRGGRLLPSGAPTPPGSHPAPAPGPPGGWARPAS